MKQRAWVLPTVLLSGTILVLIGCIPLPGLKQFQPDGSLRPDYSVGNSSDCAVWIGHTSFAEAFVRLSKQTSTRVQIQGEYDDYHDYIAFEKSPEQNLSHWHISRDQRHAFVSFELRTGTLVFPLCLQVRRLTEIRWLMLDLNPRQIVIAARTLDENFNPPDTDPREWLSVFDERTRHGLNIENVLPSDADLNWMASSRPPRLQNLFTPSSQPSN